MSVDSGDASESFVICIILNSLVRMSERRASTGTLCYSVMFFFCGGGGIVRMNMDGRGAIFIYFFWRGCVDEYKYFVSFLGPKKGKISGGEENKTNN